MRNSSAKNRTERFIWFGAGTAIIAFLFVLVASPSIFAQGGGSSSSSDRHLETFSQVFRYVQNNFVDEIDPEVLLEGALKGLFESLGDPYSAYLSPTDMRGLSDTTTGRFGGVGMYISKQQLTEEEREANKPSYVVIESPIDGTPAQRAGIRSNDLIVEIEGESTGAMTIDEVLNELRGTPGTSVEITIRRGPNLTFPVTLRREFIEVPTVRTAMIGDDIGYLRITQFTPFTDDRVRDAIDSFSSEGYSAMILDLRRNPGGLLTGVVDVANLFFSGGTIVGTRGRVASENEVITANRQQVVPDDLPIVVLIDGGSASASEILAGALKDRERAYLIGTTTFGKGSVQRVRQLGNGGFRLTMSRYYTPSGEYIDKVGVAPDKKVEEPTMSDEETKAYMELVNSGTIVEFIEETPNPTENEILGFIEQARADGYTLNEREIRRLIRDESNRARNITTVYDLEFDTVLIEAVRLLRSGEIAGR